MLVSGRVVFFFLGGKKPGLDCLLCGEQRFNCDRKITEELVEETFAANL